MSGLMPPNILSYEGLVATPFLTRTFSPTTANNTFNVPTIWSNTNEPSVWILLAKPMGVANWLKVADATKAVYSLTGNSGGPVGIDTNNNIFVVGDVNTINIVGNPGTHTLTASTGSHVATSYVEDSGTAVPSGGVLNVKGGTGITTSGAGNTITITNTGSATVLVFDADTGSATPLLDHIIMAGGTNVNTSASGNTVTFNAPTPSDVATSYVCTTGSATPSSNVLNVLGSNGITTTGSGNTVTVNGPSSGLIQQVRAQTQTAANGTASTDQMPGYNTVPTTSNGHLIFTVPITPTSSSSILLCEAHIEVGYAVKNGSGAWVNHYGQIAIFSSHVGTNAIFSTKAKLGTGTTAVGTEKTLRGYVQAGTTSTITFTLRLGSLFAPSGYSGEFWYINGFLDQGSGTISQACGGTCTSTFTISEFAS